MSQTTKRNRVRVVVEGPSGARVTQQILARSCNRADADRLFRTPLFDPNRPVRRAITRIEGSRAVILREQWNGSAWETKASRRIGLPVSDDGTSFRPIAANEQMEIICRVTDGLNRLLGTVRLAPTPVDSQERIAWEVSPARARMIAAGVGQLIRTEIGRDSRDPVQYMRTHGVNFIDLLDDAVGELSAAIRGIDVDLTSSPKHADGRTIEIINHWMLALSKFVTDYCDERFAEMEALDEKTAA